MISQKLKDKLIKLSSPKLKIKPSIDQRGLVGFKKDLPYITLTDCYLPNYGQAVKGSLIIPMSRTAEKFHGKENPKTTSELSYMVVFNPQEEITEPWITTANISEFSHESRNVAPVSELIVNEKSYIKQDDYLIQDEFPSRKEVYLMPVIVNSKRMPNRIRYVVKWSLKGIDVTLQTLRHTGRWCKIRVGSFSESEYKELVESEQIYDYIMDMFIHRAYDYLYLKQKENLLATEEAESILKQLPAQCLDAGVSCGKSLQIWYTYNYTEEFDKDIRQVNSVESYNSFIKEHLPSSLTQITRIIASME